MDKKMKNYRRRHLSRSILSPKAFIGIVLYLCLTASSATMLAQTKSVYNFYLVVSQTYFHNAPGESTKRSAYLIQDQLVFIEKTENGFGYTEYINTRGQTTKGWLKMSDLKEIPDSYTKSDSFNHDVEHNLFPYPTFSISKRDHNLCLSKI